MKTRVVITGVGVASPIGMGRDAFWGSLREGSTGFKSVTLFDTSTIHSKLAAEITDFKPEGILGGTTGLKNMDRTTKLALCAAKLALEDADFQVNKENAVDAGVVLGSTNGSIYSVSEFDKKSLRDGPYTVNPALFPNLVMCSAPSQVAIRFGLKGLSTAISSGFHSGLSSIQYAIQMLNNGHAKYLLVGAVEELCEQTFKAFYRLKLLSGSNAKEEELCAPLDERRNGFVMGEGAVIFMLESFETARRRGAKIYAEISTAFEENSLSSISQIKAYIKQADTFSEYIRNNKSGLNLNEIDFVSIGANSSRARDMIESRMINRIFDQVKDRPVVSGIKSITGESFSASEAFQILGALFCMDTGIIFPTVGIKKMDRRCQIENLALKPMKKPVKKSLVCSADLGIPMSFLTLKEAE